MATSASSSSSSPISKLIQSILDMPAEFVDVATADPISAVLVAFGTLFVAVSMGAFGYLVLGAAVDLIVPEVSSDRGSREAR